MTLKEVEDYCLKKSGSYLDFPFGPDVSVVKLKAPLQEKGRIFAQIFMLKGEPKVTFCCDRMMGEIWRDAYPGCVVRGYHCPPVQQPYFNTITLDGRLSDDVIIEMIHHSYTTALSKLSKKKQREIEAL